MISIGIKSGVNWMRLNLSDIVSASLLTINVLASPGTPIKGAWPRANRQIDSRSMTSRWPTMTLPSSLRPSIGIPKLVDRLHIVVIGRLSYG